MARETLQAGQLRLTYDAALGGAILSLTRGEEDLLRPTPDDATDVLQTASFQLVPYSNRIANGHFSFNGRAAALSRNMAGQVHPLHGEGWRNGWRVESRDERAATLVFEPTHTEWPWRYSARETFLLTERSLTIELSVTNLDDEPGPFGLGFHPFFPHSSSARLAAETTGVWAVTPDLIPIQELAVSPWRGGSAVRSDELIDHCYTGWDRDARIDLGPSRTSLRLTASPELGWLHVYAPPDQDIFCVEPVSHAPNALNMADPTANGMHILSTAETLSVWMRLDLM
jgi:aldose 1-epimerase